MTQSIPFWQSVTNRLVIICVVAYFVVNGVYRGMPSGLELYFFEHPQFRIWQLVTHVFLHGGLAHLALNMIALWSFGQILERVWGAQRFLVFFLLCGVGAGAISLLVNYVSYYNSYESLLASGASVGDLSRLINQGQVTNTLGQLATEEQLSQFYYLFNAPMIGASGAIYGILVAFTLLFPNFKVQLIFLPIPVAAKFFVPVLLLIDLAAGFTGWSIFGLNIAHFAHIGGAVVGLVLVLWWMRSLPPQPR